MSSTGGKEGRRSSYLKIGEWARCLTRSRRRRLLLRRRRVVLVTRFRRRRSAPWRGGRRGRGSSLQCGLSFAVVQVLAEGALPVHQPAAAVAREHKMVITHLVEEVTVMRDDDEDAGVAEEKVLEDLTRVN